MNTNLSVCSRSKMFLPIPYEKPKFQQISDRSWLRVNTSTSQILISNPFYQVAGHTVGRLSIELFSPSTNATYCDPKFWYSVPFQEQISCTINNPSNITIEELMVMLNASGDPLGKTPSAFASTTSVVVYSLPSNLESNSEKGEENTGAAIAGGVAAGVVVFVIIVVLLIWFVKRRRRNTPKQTWQASVALPSGLAMRDDIFATTQSSFPQGFSNGPVPHDKLHFHVKELERDSGLGYASLWEDVRIVGLQNSTITAELHVNRVKNRFTNILPYDASRVKLLPWPFPKRRERSVDDPSLSEVLPDHYALAEGEDYINANFVPGLWSDNEYIATQVSLPWTNI